jgi:glutamate-ammonia-ligase adenylyltransferase
MAILSVGRLGGLELDYSSHIELVFLYQCDGFTDGRKKLENVEYFDLLARGISERLSAPADGGLLYRVSTPLNASESGRLAMSVHEALRYYDLRGRSWERQAWIKARPTAGDHELARRFLGQLSPWVYRQYLSGADMSELKALKRRIQRTAEPAADEGSLVSSGIDILENVVRFLQVLNGGDLPEIRMGNTLDAILRLEQANCLTRQERRLLQDNYLFSRRLEHALQTMLDRDAGDHPIGSEDLGKVATRMGFRDPETRVQALRAELRDRWAASRGVLDHLLNDAFPDDASPGPEADLVFDPHPSATLKRDVLGRHGFRDVLTAYRNLADLATEHIPFLSERRCRHFFALIAPKLLATVTRTPDPDAALVNLREVSNSLGGKGVLWELFSTSTAALELYVRLCAASPYLAGILTSNPGMLDELMDSLVLDKLPTLEMLRSFLDQLCSGAADIEPILHGFKNSLHLRVGTRDVLGKAGVRDTTRVLSDIAEVCIAAAARHQYHRLLEKYGQPSIQMGLSVRPCGFAILAMGKLGGREPNYHSVLDLTFVYEAEGMTLREARWRATTEEPTSNRHFFNELVQRVVKLITRHGPYGRLYEVGQQLRVIGRSGALAVSLDELREHFRTNCADPRERLKLCQARAIHGPEELRAKLTSAVADAMCAHRWHPTEARSIRLARLALEESASPRNIKRGVGGTLDVEFAVQMLQLRYAVRSPEVAVPGTITGLTALRDAGRLREDEAEGFSQAYEFLRGVEARLRLMNTAARHDLPADEASLKGLAYLLNCDVPTLLDNCRRIREQNRHRFEHVFAEAAN